MPNWLLVLALPLDPWPPDAPLDAPPIPKMREIAAAPAMSRAADSKYLAAIGGLTQFEAAIARSYSARASSDLIHGSANACSTCFRFPLPETIACILASRPLMSDVV